MNDVSTYINFLWAIFLALMIAMLMTWSLLRLPKKENINHQENQGQKKTVASLTLAQELRQIAIRRAKAEQEQNVATQVMEIHRLDKQLLKQGEKLIESRNKGQD
ncbi:hypothetical protein [Algicola sagamiensis]|uniref:hypothetical protein n=1 Tax=Algicola sagamiensis TaxID=163869 RepID=UPI00036CDF10|nr:hypothetical protein [Algicola sagamiensis]